MRKILALMLVLCIFSAPLVCRAEEDDNRLWFDLDLSEYTDDNPIVKNGVTGSSDSITVYGREDYNAPAVNSISAISGETKYITTGHTDGAGNAYGVIQLEDALARPMSESDALTVEFWTKSDTPAASYLYYKFFKLSAFPYQSSLYDGSIDWEVSVQSAVNAENRFAKNTSDSPYYVKSAVNGFPQNIWTHYVLTREWDSVNECFNSVVYINGVKKSSGSGGMKYIENEYGFTIGGSGSAPKTYQGSFGSFRVYLSAMSDAEAKERYIATKDDYFELPKSMELLAPAQDMEISPSEGRITVEFDNFIDKSTLNEITFKTSSGEDIPGGVFVETEEGNTKTAELYFGKLDAESEYVLHIGAVSSINNYVVEARDIIIKTTGIYMVNEDFSDYPTGEIGDISDSPLTFFSSGINNSAEDFSVKEQTSKSTGETIKYLEMKTRNFTASKDSYLAYDFPSGYNKDFVAEIGVRGQGGNSNRSIRFLQSNYVTIGSFSSGTTMSNGSTVGLPTPKTYSNSITDEFGFLNMVFVFRINENGTYTVTGTCPNNPDVSYEAITNFTEAKQLRAMNQYNAGSEVLTTELSHFRLYEYVPPKIVLTNISSLNRDSDYLEVVFSDDMKGFTEDSITILKEDGQRLNTSFEEYDEDTRTARIRINEYFDYGAYYIMSADGIESTSGVALDHTETEFRIPDYELYSSVTQVYGGLSINIANNTYSPKNALIAAVCFDGEGKIIKTVSKRLDVSSISAKKENISIDDSVKKVSVYVWDVIDGENRATTARPYTFEY